jgi:hypothetical protein
MKDSMYLYRQHLRLRAASDELLVAHYLYRSASRSHVREARREILNALADTHREDRAAFEKGISDVISDSLGVDGPASGTAKAVVEHILDTLAPMPENDVDA